MDCLKFDDCDKIKAILDQDLLGIQTAVIVKNTCEACLDKKDVISVCALSGQTDICVGTSCPMYLKCRAREKA